jgi:hypothetical protein
VEIVQGLSGMVVVIIDNLIASVVEFGGDVVAKLMKNTTHLPQVTQTYWRHSALSASSEF